MLSRKILLSAIITATLLTPASFAASASPATDTTALTREERSVKRDKLQAELKELHDADVKEEKAAFKEFKKSENALFKKLPDLTKDEADKAITEFYTEAFSKMPIHRNKRYNEIIAAVESMDIPSDIKTKVITRISAVRSKRLDGMQQEIVDFARSLVDMTPEERQDAIDNYNRISEKRFAMMSQRRKHKGGMEGMRGGKRDGCKMMAMGRMRDMRGMEGMNDGDMNRGGMQCPMMMMMCRMMSNSPHDRGPDHDKFKNNNTRQHRRWNTDDDNEEEEEGEEAPAN